MTSIVRRIDMTDSPFWMPCESCARFGGWRPERGEVWHPAAASYPERFCRVLIDESQPGEVAA